MSFLKPDQIYLEIILRLAENKTLTRRDITSIIDSKFPYLPRPERYKFILKEADKYTERLEKGGLAIRASYKGKEYTLQITEKGEEQAKKLKSENNESG